MQVNQFIVAGNKSINHSFLKVFTVHITVYVHRQTSVLLILLL